MTKMAELPTEKADQTFSSMRHLTKTKKKVFWGRAASAIDSGASVIDSGASAIDSKHNRQRAPTHPHPNLTV